MNSEKTSHPHKLLVNLTDKIDLKRGEKYMLQHGVINLNYQVDSLSDNQGYFQYIMKKHKTFAYEIYIRIIFKIKSECYLELLTPETMRQITKKKKVKMYLIQKSLE